MEKPLLSFIECAIEVLRVNENQPMTSKEILIAIFDLRLRLNSSSETPEQTLNATLNRHSVNATAKGTEKFNKCIEIVCTDADPRRYRLVNYKPLTTKIYLTVMLEVSSNEILTQEHLDTIVSEVDYDFDYNEKGIKIVKTEILESEIDYKIK